MNLLQNYIKHSITKVNNMSSEQTQKITTEDVKEKLKEYKNKQKEQSDEEHKVAENKSQVDLYKILGISRDADKVEIKEKYLQLALLYHPDKETGDLQKFKDVCLAYKVLSSKKRRKEYDQALASTFGELRSV